MKRIVVRNGVVVEDGGRVTDWKEWFKSIGGNIDVLNSHESYSVCSINDDVTDYIIVTYYDGHKIHDLVVISENGNIHSNAYITDPVGVYLSSQIDELL